MATIVDKFGAPTGRPRLGPLELAVLDAMWKESEPVRAKDLVAHAFADRPLTTIVTTVERLAQKGLLAKTRIGRACYYQSIVTRAELGAAAATSALMSAIEGIEQPQDLRVLMASIVDALGEHETLLDSLERLIQLKRSGESDQADLKVRST